MDSEVNKRKDKIAKSGFAQSNAYKTTTSVCNEPSLIGTFKYIPAIISNEFKPSNSILIEVIRYFINLIFHKYFMGYRRKMHAASLCKSIMFSIQWFQILHIITYSTIYNKVVGLSGARVSPFHASVPQLIYLEKQLRDMVFVSISLLKV